MVRILKTFVIWCSLSFICTFAIYLLHGENLLLLMIDFQNLFTDNRYVFWSEIFPLIVILTLFLGICLFKKWAFCFTVSVSVVGGVKD